MIETQPLNIHLINKGSMEQTRSKNVLYDAHQHAVFLIDDLAKEILTTCQDCTEEEISARLSNYPAENVRAALGELETKLKGPPATFSWIKPWRSMKLHVSHDCNLRCRYCYGWQQPDQGMYNGTAPEMMSEEIAYAAVKRLLQAVPRGDSAAVTLHGGEPLLNWPVVKSVVEFGKELADELGNTIEFAVATNGTIFREDIAYLFATAPVHVMVSLDGDELCNTARVFPDTRPAFQLILKNIQRYMNTGCRVSAEATVHHKNLDLVKIAQFLREQGMESLLFNHNRSCNDEYSLTELDQWQLMRQYDKLILWERSKYNPGPGPSFFVTNVGGPYESLMAGKPIVSHCPLGMDAVSIAPDGNVYVCELFMFDQAHSLGNIRDEKISYELDFLRELMVDRREHCKDCWARFLCGGPCAYEALIRNGTISSTPEHGCQLQQSIAECIVTAFAYQDISLPEKDLYMTLIDQS